MSAYGDAAQASSREDTLAGEIIKHFMQLVSDRSLHAVIWEETAALVRPNSRNTFQYGSYNSPGMKKTERQIDATGMMALSRFGAILDSLLTPRNQTWHQLTASDEYLMKDREVKLWFETATRLLFKMRYSPTANFAGQNFQNYLETGAFGNAAMYMDSFQGPAGGKGFRYKSIPVGELFFIENHQGMVVGFCRWFRMKADQVVSMFGEEKTPEQIVNAKKQNSQIQYEFLHYVVPNENFDPERLSYQFKAYKSCYVSMTGKKLMREGGYNTLPLAISRYEQAPGEVYGRGPATMVLPALKTLNAQKMVYLKQGHRAADPVLLTADDGLVDINMRPGALNKGGWSSEGRPLIGTLPTGDIQVTKEMMDEERGLINDAFLVTLFQILTESPAMTATEVVERTNEKGILLAPTIGRQQSEYLGPMIERELDLAGELGLLPPMPQALREAQGEYNVVYTSPLSRAARSQEVAGAMRTIETALNIVNATQDPSHLDQFDFDVIIPQIAEIQGVPESWMAGAEAIAKKREERAAQQQQQMEIQAAPAAAAMVKAKAVAEKGK